MCSGGGNISGGISGGGMSDVIGTTTGSGKKLGTVDAASSLGVIGSMGLGSCMICLLGATNAG